MSVVEGTDFRPDLAEPGKVDLRIAEKVEGAALAAVAIDRKPHAFRPRLGVSDKPRKSAVPSPQAWPPFAS